MASVDLIADVASPAATPSVRAGAGRLAASQGFQFVVRLGNSLALARLLDPRDFGLLGIVSVLVVLLQRTLGDGGMVQALVQRERVSRELASSVFFFNVLVGLGTTTVLVAAAPWISRALGDADATGVLRGIALSFAIAGFAKVPEAMLRRSMQYGKVALFGSTNALVTAAVAIPLAVAGHGVASMVIGQVAGVFVEAVLAWLMAGWRPMATFRRRELRRVTSFARNTTAFNLVNYFADAGDKFVVGRFVGTTALGLYSLPYRLLFAPVFAIAQVYRDLLFPVFSRNQHDDEAIGRTYLRAVGAMSLVTFPLCAITAVLGQPLVDAGLGAKWHEAGPILSVMAIVALLQSVLVTGGIILSAKDRTDVLLRWGIVAGLTMFGSYAVGAIWGAMGVSVAFLLATVVLAYPAMKLPFRELSLPVRRLVVALLPAGAVTAVLAGCAFLARVVLEGQGAPDLTVASAGAVFGAAGYLAALAWLRPDAADDLLSMLKRRSTP